MTIARCFGGTLDGTWRTMNGRELLAPVMDWQPALTLDVGDPRASLLRVHQYTLQKFVVGVGAVTWETLWGDYREPIYFHALIGPGFTVAMVKAWLDGWIEEADKLTKEAKVQDTGAERARQEIDKLEQRIQRQAGLINDLREAEVRRTRERDEARAELNRVRRIAHEAVRDDKASRGYSGPLARVWLLLDALHLIK